MSTGLLDEILGRVAKLAPENRKRLWHEVREATKNMPWVPNPGPQTDAFYCEAEELGYGGELGGGKSGLIVGLSLTEHTLSLLLRRTNKEAEKFVNEYESILGARKGWNGRGTWSLPGRKIDLGGCEHEHDKQKRKGFPHDLIAFDQVEDFTETQYTFIIGWNRTTKPNQRCRVVATFNPPTRPEGLWVVRRWAAWLDPRHPNPAQPGELRWYTTINGRDTECDGPDPIEVDGEMIQPKSRTFIRATLDDNPELESTGYGATIAAMPDDLRTAFKGDFGASLHDSPRQIIPTQWIREAQQRWEDKPPIGVPMCAIAADCSGGGRDPLVVGWRHDYWFSEFEVVEGKELPQDKIGRYTAGVVISFRRDRATIIIDMGGGYGSAAFEHLKTNLDDGSPSQLMPLVVGHKGAEGTTQRTRPDHQLAFKNKRTMALWRVREALDPGQSGGSPMMLPDDPEMVADLTAVTFWVTGSTIEAESKEDVCARLGRSTNKGDTVCMLLTAGATASTDGAIWEQQQKSMRHPLGRRPQVLKPSRNSGRR